VTTTTPVTGRLRSRRALVSGGASGIGLATVRRLAAEGAAVVLTDARADGVAEASAACDVAGLVMDVTDPEAVARAVDAAAERLDGLDLVVTCAGVVRVGATHETTLDDWHTVIGVNLTGTFLVLRATLPHLLATGGGTVVTIGSVASVVAAGRTSSYDASKGGVLQLTRAVAVEYCEQGVRANCVLPGVVATGLAANSSSLHGPMVAPTAPSTASRLRIPVERRADPAEIASVVAFLSSDDASFMTGAAVPVDGGYTAI
jgi:NAD(P)-dependent dehydrogenase (short-subunit alcohol dehydrogenase family)